MSPSGPLAVLGAINVDLVVSGAALPGPGETVVGGAFARHQGGKGGNQAVAAARAGADVVMLGAIGRDAFGDEALQALQAEGIDTMCVRSAEVSTGVALIAVDDTGENQISVAPGANETVGDLRHDLDRSNPSVVLASCEVPPGAVRSAASWCRERGLPFVLNPAPASQELRELLGNATVVTPNAGELALLLPGVVGVEASANTLVTSHPNLSLVVTVGSGGAVVVTAGGRTEVAAPEVDAVDTTGAGDCFNGVLAAALWEGRELLEAVRRGVVAAALSVEVAGAREGMPTRPAIDGRVAGLS